MVMTYKIAYLHLVLVAAHYSEPYL